uniref:TIGR02646 family protein n=1 Tax=Candidatus Kentrum eta TaxID=2126337 RepID=A0A450UEA5_9GAMM|nr:MAG: hypothetical protein BECKH772A_GA0070896_100189 [Candidatus Kentron sp. H]VFJ90905.1 MAG: hypothetical protein BECKH772B_GA0070898_1001213 [Candidatus Kentron sp. H]VFJ97919.1 MAG: hypothetical protein BECKH772C_GA0070978_100179 [Candidatus Kentron sp. H]
MNPVTPQPEPEAFDARVRRPGQRYLATVGKNNAVPIFRGRNKYWTEALDDLREAYKKICAYTCFYLPPSPGSVDHFRPKSRHPELAYEWDNFRLALPIVNSHKGDSMDVLDPFQVEAGWFVLDFPSCLVKAGPGLSQSTVDRVNRTIDRLKLNDDDSFVEQRREIMIAYSEGEMDLSFLERFYPFIAAEIDRQGIEGKAGALFKRRTISANPNAPQARSEAKQP